MSGEREGGRKWYVPTAPNCMRRGLRCTGEFRGGRGGRHRGSPSWRDGESQAEEFPFGEQFPRENCPTGKDRRRPWGEPPATGSEDGIPGERCRTEVLQDCSGAGGCGGAAPFICSMRGGRISAPLGWRGEGSNPSDGRVKEPHQLRSCVMK